MQHSTTADLLLGVAACDPDEGGCGAPAGQPCDATCPANASLEAATLFEMTEEDRADEADEAAGRIVRSA